jgi:heptosyltransferase-1
MTSPPPARILVVRLSAIGDVIMASGLVPALRATWPAAQLAWLTEPVTAPLLRHNPRLDEVLVWPRAHWRQLWTQRRFGALRSAVMEFRAQLRARRFDLVIDAQGLLKSAACAALTGAPRRVGLNAREGSRLLVHERVALPGGDDSRIGREYRHLARVLGAPEGAFALDLAVGTAPRDAARAALQARGVAGTYAVLCPFTTRPQKHWFEERWSALAQRLHARGVVPVLLGGPADTAAAARIAAGSAAVVDLTGRLALDESVAVVEGAQLLVGVDTGLTHAGSALRVPTVALFGSTRPYLDAGTPRTAVLYDALPCAPCRRHPTCDGRFDCMRGLGVDRVYLQAQLQMAMA